MGIRTFRTKQMEWREVLVAIVKLLQPDTYVEVGVRECYTFNAIAPLVKGAIAVDHKDYRAKLVDLAHVEFILSDSVEAVGEWGQRIDPSIDLLFIDANHHWENTLANFDAWSPFVKPQTGIIAMHDTCPAYKDYYRHQNDAWKAAYKIRTDENYHENFEIMSFPGPYSGMSFIRKAKEHLPELV